MLRSFAPVLLLATSLGLQGCIYITEAEWEAFNDRDQDGLDFGVDCDDSNDQVQGTVKFYPDADGDGFGDAEGQAVDACATAPPHRPVRPPAGTTARPSLAANPMTPETSSVEAGFTTATGLAWKAPRQSTA